MMDVIFDIDAVQWSEIIRNYALVAFGAFTTYVAWKGLSTWKKQNVWQEDRELAKRVFFNIEQLRCNLLDVRMITIGKSYSDYEALSENILGKDFMKTISLRTSKQVDEKRSKIEELFQELEFLTFETNVQWGEDLESLRKTLESKCSDLRLALASRVVALEMFSEDKIPFKKNRFNYESISIRQSADTDKLDSSLEDTFKKIKDILKMKMASKP